MVISPGSISSSQVDMCFQNVFLVNNQAVKEKTKTRPSPGRLDALLMLRPIRLRFFFCCRCLRCGCFNFMKSSGCGGGGGVIPIFNRRRRQQNRQLRGPSALATRGATASGQPRLKRHWQRLSTKTNEIVAVAAAASSISVRFIRSMAARSIRSFVRCSIIF